ncbi:MAG: hypothetical protein FJW56_00170 [Actinobacteria bacterium]|nr:hypothetical protein [Actinomycetota bacterium]
MLKELINECKITFSIKTDGPILVKKQIDKNNLTSDEEDYLRSIFNLRPNDRLPDAAFVRTLRNGKLVPYIPGSSFKGILRSHSEKIIHTLLSDGCCNPFQMKGVKEDENIVADDLSCTGRLQILKENSPNKKLPNNPFYLSCPVCKLLGNGYLQSRLLIPDGYSDAYNNKPVIRGTQTTFLPKRDGVGIDRYSGGAVSGVKFDFEVEENAVFKFEDIIIRNFDLWQLGLLAYVFQDFEDKLIKIGFGKSRGLGKVSGMVEKMDIVYYGNRKPNANKLAGIAHFIGDSEYYNDTEKAQLIREISLPFEKQLISNGYRHTYSFSTNSEAKAVLSSAAETFSNENNTGYLNGSVYNVPEKMRKTFLERLKSQTENVNAEINNG